MSFWNFWKSKAMEDHQMRKIKTLRGQKKIDEAISNGSKLIYRKVEAFSAVKGKYCVVRNKKTFEEHKIYDFRDEKGYSDEFEIVKDWTYLYHKYNFPKEAAYLIPNDIKKGEIVFVDDLIENFLGYHHNQGESGRLKSCKAVWKNNDLQIQYNPDHDCMKIIG
jgi:hypothetical protein